MKRTLKAIHIPSLIAALLAAVFACGRACGDGTITSISQLTGPGIVIAVSDSTPEEAQVRKDFPDAEIRTYTDIIASYSEVVNGKADACIHARREMEMALENDVSGVRLLEEAYCWNIVAVGISRVSPIPDLRGKINAFIKDLQADGTLDDMYDRWVIRGEMTMPDIPAAENGGGVIRVGTTGNIMPYSYYSGEELAGYDIELAKRFAAWLGAELEFQVYSFSGVLAAAQAGKVDCIMSNLYYTKEHEEAIDFSDTLFRVEVTAMVKDESAGAGASFWDSLAAGFEKTFIREDRWKLLLQGTGMTLLISALAVLLGTVLGFAVYMACRKGNRFANRVTRFCIWLVEGMPAVVFLMILYYIIFGRARISATAVSVIGFSLIFGCAVYTMLKTGVGAVDRGQAEAAYALGFSERRTFFLTVLPQAVPHIMPTFSGQITALIKATSVVGYIAVQDLTKMGDIIRSRTYDAFFPLIAVSVIYFILEGLIGMLAGRLTAGLNRRARSRSRYLKGVQTAAAPGGAGTGEAAAPAERPETREEPLIRIEHLRKEFPEAVPLEDVNLEIRDGDVISVIGPSGTGKSTLLRCMNMLEKPTGGRILLDGEEITAPKADVSRIRRRMGMVFQNFTLFGHLNVIENLMFGPVELMKKPRQEAYDEGMRLLRQVNLAEKAMSYPDELSGGQKQRVAIARALAMGSDIILFDEPTSALDPAMVGEVQAVIRELAGTGKTMMIVTHEMAFARAICSRVVYLDEGGVYDEGPPEQIFEHPRREKTRWFLWRLKVLEIEIQSREFDYLGTVSRITQFCAKNLISRRMANRIQLAFEELVRQITAAAGDAPQIRIVFEYDEDEEKTVMTAYYNGSQIDLSGGDDPLSGRVLRGIAREIRGAAAEPGDYDNRVALEISGEK